MSDQLCTAWDLLRPEEGPEGMEWTPGGPTQFRDNRVPEPYQNWVWDHDAYDRLCQAVEAVNLELGLMHTKDLGQHAWHKISGYCMAVSKDRLTAACAALAAERGTDAQAG